MPEISMVRLVCVMCVSAYACLIDTLGGDGNRMTPIKRSQRESSCCVGLAEVNHSFHEGGTRVETYFIGTIYFP